MDLLNLGYIIKTHGLDGTLVISSNTYFGQDRYKKGAKLFLLNPHNKELTPVTVSSYRNYKETDYVKFEEINDIDTATLYKGYTVEIEKVNAVLPKDYYLFSDLEGCKIITDDNKELGICTKVEEFPAQITLRCITNDKKEFFVPFIDKVFIQDVDIKNKIIIIKYMDGMIE